MTPEAVDRRGRVFELLYRDGCTCVVDDPRTNRKQRFNFRTQFVCDVYFPSGKVVACDPTDGLCFGTTPFTRTIPRGTYSVYVSVSGPARRPKVMSAKLERDSIAPDKWELALRPKQNIKRLKKREFFGFGVDAGMAAVGDHETFQITNSKHDRDQWWESIVDGWKTHQEWSVPSSKRHNIAMFASGLGDGHYPSFWGTTKRGRVLCLVIDFCVIPWDSDPAGWLC